MAARGAMCLMALLALGVQLQPAAGVPPSWRQPGEGQLAAVRRSPAFPGALFPSWSRLLRLSAAEPWRAAAVQLLRSVQAPCATESTLLGLASAFDQPHSLLLAPP